MRAKEFTINIPINIKINSDGTVEQGETEVVDDETGTFVPPLQRKIELMKKNSGVSSVYEPSEDDDEDDSFFDPDDEIGE